MKNIISSLTLPVMLTYRLLDSTLRLTIISPLLLVTAWFFFGCAGAPAIDQSKSVETEEMRFEKMRGQQFEAFREKAKVWRALPTKPELPEAARKYKVLAANDYKEKIPEQAIKHIIAGLAVEPLWPEGHFDVALLMGEAGAYSNAIYHMRCYLELVPDAREGRAARDKIIIWEEKKRAGDELRAKENEIRKQRLAEEEANATSPLFMVVLILGGVALGLFVF